MDPAELDDLPFADPEPRTDLPAVIDRFEVGPLLGRGGMGTVHEAFERGLDRKVALKVVPVAEAAWDLLREARLAASLAHHHIVPVHAAGSSGSFIWIAMRWIDGPDLDQLIRDLRQWRRVGAKAVISSSARALIARLQAEDGIDAETWPSKAHVRFVARVGAEIAEALGHAHDAKILHRDVKPSNILIDAQGSAWITDFGIASRGADLGPFGAKVGTPRYAAPEAGAAEPTVAEDLYALGRTLLEFALLERDPPQGAPRSLPQTLGEILTKASAPWPQARYGSALALAEDLRDLLAGRPTEAERRAPWRSAVRLAKTHRRAALGIAVAFLCVALAAGFGWRRSLDAELALGREEAARELAEVRLSALREANLRAEGNLATALRGFAAVFDRLAPRDALQEDELDPLTFHPLAREDLEVVQALLKAHAELEAANPHSEELRRATVASHRRAGDAHRWCGDLRGAESAYVQALELLDLSEAALESLDADERMERLVIEANLGAVLLDRGDIMQGRWHLDRARRGLEAFGPGADETTLRYRRARVLAAISDTLAVEEWMRPPPPIAARLDASGVRHAREALALLAEPPPDAPKRWWLLRAHIALGLAERFARSTATDRKAEASVLSASAAADLQLLAAEASSSSRYREVQARAALVRTRLAEDDATLRLEYGEAQAHARELLSLHPSSRALQQLLIDVLVAGQRESLRLGWTAAELAALARERFDKAEGLLGAGAPAIAEVSMAEAALDWLDLSIRDHSQREAAHAAIVRSAEAWRGSAGGRVPWPVRPTTAPRLVRALRMLGEEDLAQALGRRSRVAPWERGARPQTVRRPSGEAAPRPRLPRPVEAAPPPDAPLEPPR